MCPGGALGEESTSKDGVVGTLGWGAPEDLCAKCWCHLQVLAILTGRWVAEN